MTKSVNQIFNSQTRHPLTHSHCLGNFWQQDKDQKALRNTVSLTRQKGESKQLSFSHFTKTISFGLKLKSYGFF